MAEAGESSESSCGEKKPNLMYTSTSRGSHKGGATSAKRTSVKVTVVVCSSRPISGCEREKVGTQTKDVEVAFVDPGDSLD
jgi:hypothetical protein